MIEQGVTADINTANLLLRKGVRANLISGILVLTLAGLFWCRLLSL